jgi:hypothetical protein
MPHPVVHFEIGCKDRPKTCAFYRELFGWTVNEDENSPAAMVHTGTDAGIQGHVTALGHEPHHYMNMYVLCDTLEDTVAKAEKLGGKVLVPPTDVPGMGRFAWIADVEGLQVGLWEAAEG